MGAPVEMRRLSHIVQGEIVIGYVDIQSLVYIPEIFVSQSEAVIFGMTCGEEQPLGLIRNYMHAGLL